MFTPRDCSREKVGTQFVGTINGNKVRLIKALDDRTMLNCWTYANASVGSIEVASSSTVSLVLNRGKFTKYAPREVNNFSVVNSNKVK